MIIFFRATSNDCLQVKRCLQLYEAASGKLINFEKSSVTFCPSSSPIVTNEIMRTLNIPVVKGHDLYLGLPTFSLQSKWVQFSSLRERICKRIQGWAARMFSAGGKEVLIKAILQAIPSYSMSCFKIPISICKELEQFCAKFWLRSSGGNRGVQWSKWAAL